MRSDYGLYGLAMGVPLITAAWMGACSSDGATAPPVDIETCEHPGCPGWGDAGPKEAAAAEAQPGLSDVDNYDGPRANAKGSLWLMKPPNFGIDQDSITALTFPARVHIAAFGVDYTTDYQPDGGFFFADVPSGTATNTIFTMLAEDIDDKNDIVSAVAAAVVPPASSLDIVVASKSYWTQVLASVDPPLALDPTKTQVLVTVLVSKLDPEGMPNVVFAPTANAEAILYASPEGPQGWVRDKETGTGGNGTALIVNMDANALPGDTVKLPYKKSGGKGEIPGFRVCQGAMARVIWYEAQGP